MSDIIEIWRNPQPGRIGHSVKEFLYNLNGPTWLDIGGRDSSRRRVVVTLLHGNEPSGVKALFNWLTDPERRQPETALSILICSVEAALTEPEFSRRYMPGLPDMNRCFRPPFDSANGRIAREILTRIERLHPEAVVDMHNTSGSGPDFTVTTKLDDCHVRLAKNFSGRLILTELRLGALMEADFGCPVITLECGGSIDLKADQTALKAIHILAGKQNLFLDGDSPLPDILKHPLRFEIAAEASLEYAKSPVTGIDITLVADIEKHNFGITAQNEFLGWLGPRGLDYFSAIDDAGNDIKHELFTVQDNMLYTAQPLRLFMVTPRPEIAKKDCLFYLVRADQ